MLFPWSNYSPNISSSLFHIPSPSMQYENEFFQYFHDHHDLFQPSHDDQNLHTNMAEDSHKGFKNKKSAASKKDRHSKINTAHGPRDRRMRLSVEVARKLFNLQDLLRFDKASKTVEWLLTKSKSAVNELLEKINKENYASSSSESCEVISGVIDEYPATNNDIHKQPKKKVKSIRRAPLIHPVIAKESRKQARVRARERTKIKKGLIGKSMADDDLKRLGSWSPFEDHQSGIQGYNTNNMKHNCNMVDIGNWSPFTIFNYHHINTENSQEHELTNFQYSGKLWEA